MLYKMAFSTDPFMIRQQFAQTPLYVTDDDYYQKLSDSNFGQGLILQGENNKKTLVVCSWESGHELPSEEYQPLVKLLHALQLQVEDIYLINGNALPHQAFNYLVHQFQFSTCLFFGKTPAQAGLSVNVPLNRLFHLQEKLLFFTNSLSVLVANKNQEKQQMWKHLKDLPDKMK